MKLRTKLGLALISLFTVLSIAGIAYALNSMTVSLSPTTPPGGNISATSTSVALAAFDLTSASTTPNAKIDKITIKNFGNSSSTPNIFSKLYLYDNDTLIASTTQAISNSYFVFKNFDYPVASGATKTLTVKADLGSGATVGQTITLGLAHHWSVRVWDQLTGAIIDLLGNFPIMANTFTIQ